MSPHRTHAPIVLMSTMLKDLLSFHAKLSSPYDIFHHKIKGRRLPRAADVWPLRAVLCGDLGVWSQHVPLSLRRDQGRGAHLRRGRSILLSAKKINCLNYIVYIVLVITILYRLNYIV